MIFKKCTCGVDLGLASAEKIKVNSLGMWFSCRACNSTAIITVKELRERAHAKADGDPFKALEAEYFAERFKEVLADPPTPVTSEWYRWKKATEPDWRPYCGCCSTFDRMQDRDFGYECLICKNQIGFDCLKIKKADDNGEA